MNKDSHRALSPTRQTLGVGAPRDFPLTPAPFDACGPLRVPRCSRRSGQRQPTSGRRPGARSTEPQDPLLQSLGRPVTMPTRFMATAPLMAGTAAGCTLRGAAGAGPVGGGGAGGGDPSLELCGHCETHHGIRHLKRDHKR